MPLRFYNESFGFVCLVEPGLFFFDMQSFFEILLPGEYEKFKGANGYVCEFF